MTIDCLPHLRRILLFSRFQVPLQFFAGHGCIFLLTLDGGLFHRMVPLEDRDDVLYVFTRVDTQYVKEYIIILEFCCFLITFYCAKLYNLY